MRAPRTATRGRRAKAWLATSDGRAVAILVAIPLVAFVIPAATGHPAIAGDNVIQNFPLRVQTGQQIRAGHLPLWNPYVWSGSPLLGGLNAGSFYPTTFFFVFLPSIVAWVANLLAVYWAAGLGMYALLRQYRLNPLSCLLGAATYAFSGAMAGQMVHLGVVQGLGWIPLLVLAQLRLSWAVLGGAPGGSGPLGRRGSPWPWVVLLAGTGALILLTGEPRSMVTMEIVAPVVGVWLLCRRAPGLGVTRRLAYIGLSVLGALWAVALAAAQLLPGWAFINASQRSQLSYSFFASGSLAKSWSVLFLVPDLFGGDGILKQPTFFNSYNLPEVLGYVGLLPLVAALVLATRCFGRRRDPRAGDWGVWLLLVVLGLLLACGSTTPLGPVFHVIPLFGKTRLQSRNLAITDLGLAVLFAFWADRALAGDNEAAGTEGWRRWIAGAAPAAAALVCLVAIVIPGPLERAFGVGSLATQLGRDMTPWFIVQLVVIGAVLALLFVWHSLPARARHRWLSAVFVLDLAILTLTSSTGLLAGNEIFFPNAAKATAALGTQGRFGVYDTTAVNLDDLTEIGQPDLNGPFTKLPSVQGYGSIVSNAYATATGSHLLDTLDACALARGEFVPLRLHTLLTVQQFLSSELSPGQTLPRGSSGGVPAPYSPPEPCPGAPTPGRPGTRWWYLGVIAPLATVHLRATSSAALRSLVPGAVQVGVITPEGAMRFPSTRVVRSHDGLSVSFAQIERAAGVVVRVRPGHPMLSAASFSDTSSTTDAIGNQYYFNGPLQDVIGQAAWRYRGTWREYARFVHPALLPPVWLEHPASGSRVRQVSTTSWGTEVDRVHAAQPVTVVRSEAYSSGWHVQATSTGSHRVLQLAVRRLGLVQTVRVPPGDWTLTFTYLPGTIAPGIAVSAAALAALAAVGVMAFARHRRATRGVRH